MSLWFVVGIAVAFLTRFVWVDSDCSSWLLLGDGPNTVSESTVSNAELSEFFALTELRGENSVSSSQAFICVTKRTHRVFDRTHRVCPNIH